MKNKSKLGVYKKNNGKVYSKPKEIQSMLNQLLNTKKESSISTNLYDLILKDSENTVFTTQDQIKNAIEIFKKHGLI